MPPPIFLEGKVNVWKTLRSWHVTIVFPWAIPALNAWKKFALTGNCWKVKTFRITRFLQLLTHAYFDMTTGLNKCSIPGRLVPEKSLCCHALQCTLKKVLGNGAENEKSMSEIPVQMKIMFCSFSWKFGQYLWSGNSVLTLTKVWYPTFTDELPVISVVWVVSEQSHTEEHSLPILASPDFRSMRQISYSFGLNDQVV